MKEGKKAPGQYSNFVYGGRVGIGSLFLNFISCKSVSTCRLLPSLPALLLAPDIFCSKSIAVPGSVCCVLHFSHASPAALHCLCSFAYVLCASSACCISYFCEVRLCGSVPVKLIINISGSACSIFKCSACCSANALLPAVHRW